MSCQLFRPLYEQHHPLGNIGRGTHYSVYRSVIWHGYRREPLLTAAILDFAVIWDEDHDTRVLDLVASLYIENLLSPVRFIGERKGALTVLIATESIKAMSSKELEEYKEKISVISEANDSDPWPSAVFLETDEQSALIQDDWKRTDLYLSNIKMLWRLGIQKPCTVSHVGY